MNYLDEVIQYKDESQIYFTYGMSHYYLGDYENARLYLNKTYVENPTLGFAKVVSDYQEGKHDDAIEKLRAIKAQYPDMKCVALAILGVNELENGNIEEGNNFLLKAREDQFCSVLRI